MGLVIVGSVAFDTIQTPETRRERIIGGSCTYSALAASYFTRPRIVAVVGEDFPKPTADFLKKRGVDLKGLTVVPQGKTFREDRYGDDPNQRDTVRLDLNVFRDFRPTLLLVLPRPRHPFPGQHRPRFANRPVAGEEAPNRGHGHDPPFPASSRSPRPSSASSSGRISFSPMTRRPG